MNRISLGVAIGTFALNVAAAPLKTNEKDSLNECQEIRSALVEKIKDGLKDVAILIDQVKDEPSCSMAEIKAGKECTARIEIQDAVKCHQKNERKKDRSLVKCLVDTMKTERDVKTKSTPSKTVEECTGTLKELMQQDQTVHALYQMFPRDLLTAITLLKTTLAIEEDKGKAKRIAEKLKRLEKVRDFLKL